MCTNGYMTITAAILTPTSQLTLQAPPLGQITFFEEGLGTIVTLLVVYRLAIPSHTHIRDPGTFAVSASRCLIQNKPLWT